MENRQRREIDSLVRVRAFIDERPAREPLSYGDAPEALDEVIARLDAHAGAQALGAALGRAEVCRQQEQMAVLLDVYIRPIALIARAQIEPGTDVGLPAGLRMPKTPFHPARALAASHAMIEAARPFEALFVSKGLPPDFLARFEAARDALAATRGNRATQVGRRVSARQGLEADLRRGRRLVSCLDGIVRASFRGDVPTLHAWRLAKRVHHATGGGGSPAAETASEGVIALAA